MEQRPSREANRFSASQKIPRILWNERVHYRNHKCPPPIPILNQLDPIHDPISHFLKINLNIIFPSMPVSSNWSFSPHVSPPNPVYVSPFPYSSTYPAHLILFDLIPRIIFGEKFVSLRSSLRSFLHFPATSSLLGPNILFSTLFSNTLSLRSSLNVSNQV